MRVPAPENEWKSTWTEKRCGSPRSIQAFSHQAISTPAANETVYGNEDPQRCRPTCRHRWRLTPSSHFVKADGRVGLGLIYAGAQKNIGPAGVTIIIVRATTCSDRAPKNIPSVFHYKAHGGQPFAVQYTAGVFDLRHRADAEVDQGAGRLDGASAVRRASDALRRARRQQTVQGARSESRPLAHERGIRHGQPDTDAAFKKFCDEARGLKSPKGIESGGMRASLYNAMPIPVWKRWWRHENLKRTN